MANPFYDFLKNNQSENTSEITVFWTNAVGEKDNITLVTQGGKQQISNFSSLCPLSSGDRVFVMQHKSDYIVLGKVI